MWEGGVGGITYVREKEVVGSKDRGYKRAVTVNEVIELLQ